MKTIPYGKAICYSGYRTGQSPITKTYPTYDQIKEDLEILVQDYQYIRLYDASKHAAITLDVIRREKLPLKVMLGIDLLGEISNPQCAWGGEYTEAEIKRNIAYNEAQLQEAIRLANEYQDIVHVVSAGNEAVPEWNENLVSPKRVLYYVKQFKKHTKQLVTYCENNHYWKDMLRDVAKEVDIISVHTYPVWLSYNVEDSKRIAKEDLKAIQELYPNKQCIITETGWPTVSNHNSIPSEYANQINQKDFIDDMNKWSENEQVIIYFFEAFDEPWKGSKDKSEPEKHWGLYDVKRQPKLVKKLQKNL